MQRVFPSIYRFFAIAIIIFSCLSFSSNPPNGLTGAPGDATCNNCHFGGTQTGSVDIVGITDNPIIPNKTYNVSIRISLASGTSTRAGFQFVALDGNLANSASVGTISNLGTNVGTATSGSRIYAEHNGGENTYSGGDAVYTFDWTAPASSTSDIAFYAVANIADGSGPGGDLIVFDNDVNIALPVELTDFDVAANRNSEVQINWSSASESNSDYFEVLRSKDGIEYKTIAKVSAAGYSTDLLSYSFTDREPILNRNSFYKLKQVDLDGQYAYSSIAAIQIESFEDYFINMFPNPALSSECLFIDFIAKTAHPNAKISIYDFSGRIVLDDPQMYAGIKKGFNKFVFDVNSLPKGQYFLNIIDEGGLLKSESFVLMQ